MGDNEKKTVTTVNLGDRELSHDSLTALIDQINKALENGYTFKLT